MESLITRNAVTQSESRNLKKVIYVQPVENTQIPEVIEMFDEEANIQQDEFNMANQILQTPNSIWR